MNDTNQKLREASRSDEELIENILNAMALSKPELSASIDQHEQRNAIVIQLALNFLMLITHPNVSVETPGEALGAASDMIAAIYELH